MYKHPFGVFIKLTQLYDDDIQLYLTEHDNRIRKSDFR